MTTWEWDRGEGKQKSIISSRPGGQAKGFFFATDFPMWDAKTELERFYKIPLTDEEREMIFNKNIKRVLNI